MKLTMNCAAIATLLQGNLHGSDGHVAGNLSTDSRSVMAGDIFVALVGERFDGHAYLPQVAERGAALAIVSKHQVNVAIPQLVVADTLLAYGQLAGYLRDQFKGVVFGITGSSGKTSCKEMLVAILSEAGSVHATAANFNNEVGVPLTLSQIEPEHDFAVVEMGAGKPDDIAYLVDFAKPNVALVTNVGEAHLELFGSVENIGATKKQIYNATEQLRAAVVHGDDALTGAWAEELRALGLAVLSFGLEDHNDVCSLDLQLNIDGSRFTLRTPQGEVGVSLAVPGYHMVKNACATAAMALHAGVSLDDIARGLANYHSVNGRLAIRKMGDISLIDDTYNANPRSMRAAIDTLSLSQARRVLIVGDMAELGSDAEQLHRAIGEYARGKIEAWFSAGTLMASAAQGYGEGAVHCSDVETLNRLLPAQIKAGDTLLVKGSRSSRMERVITAIEEYIKEGAA